jgi:hypothetical protein
LRNISWTPRGTANLTTQPSLANARPRYTLGFAPIL